MIHPVTGGEVGGFSIFYYKKKNSLGIYIFPLFGGNIFLYGGKILRVHQIFFLFEEKKMIIWRNEKKGQLF